MKKTLVFLMAVGLFSCSDDSKAKLQDTCSQIKTLQQQVETMEFVNKEHVELWADATNLISSNSDIDYTFFIKTAGSIDVPVILVDSTGNVVIHRNLDIDEPSLEEISNLSKEYSKLEVSFYKRGKHIVYYGESKNVVQLKKTISELGVECQ
jgi:hypothetical protein